MEKNDFLMKDRSILMRENYELRRRNDSLHNIIEVKDRLRDSFNADPNEIFEVLVESASAARMSKITESVEEDERQVQSILEEGSCGQEGFMEKSDEAIIDRNSFALASHPLSYNVSQSEENEISMSNIGQTQTVLVQGAAQTPELPKENVYIQCHAGRAEGVMRAFYLSLIQKKETTRTFIGVIESLRHDDTVVLYEPYPTN